MLVREAMGDPVDTCGLDVTVAQVAQRMSAEDHGAMPVAVQGFLVGIITERDIMRSVGLGNDPDVTTVNDVMTPDPDYLEPDVTVEDAAEWMLAAGYRHLPIAEAGKIVGMLSIKDVLWALTDGTEGAAGARNRKAHQT